MKLTFAYDGTLLRDSNGKWYGRNYSILPNRYKVLSDDITFLMRTRNDDSAALKMSPMPSNICVVSVPDFLKIRSMIRDYTKAIKIIEKQIKNTDCVIVRMPGIISRIAIKYAKKYNKPYIVEVVGCVKDSLKNHSIKGKILAPLEFYIMKKIIYQSPYVMYVTNEFLQKRYPCNGKTIGVSDVQLERIQNKDINRRIDSVNMKEYVIGTAGAVNVRYKGQEYVIRAISKAKDNSDRCFVYRIVGGGDNSRLVSISQKYGVENNVIFDGSLPYDSMKEWYDLLDIYIQPSTVEGMPRALIEAMSRGLVCFGANVGGIPELLPKECLFSAGDDAEIFKKINEISVNDMIRFSEMNLIKSQEFESSVLKEKREQFYFGFLCDQGWKKIDD